MVKIGSKAHEEETILASVAEVEQVIEPASIRGKKPRLQSSQPTLQDHELEQVTESSIPDTILVSKEITIDTLRGLYWMATPDHVGDKKTARGPLKRKLNDLLLTKDGMRTFLKSLEEHVFS